jgi:hypothetical protein
MEKPVGLLNVVNGAGVRLGPIVAITIMIETASPMIPTMTPVFERRRVRGGGDDGP